MRFVHKIPLRELLLSALSGVLLVISFVPWNYSACAWGALIPLCMVLLPQDENAFCRSPFLYCYVTGLIFWFGTVYWLAHVTIPGMIAMVFYLALYFGFWGKLVTLFRQRWPLAQGWSHVLIAFFAACSWVGMEWIRSWMISGFPWNNLGVSQYSNLPLIQMSAWTGVYGVSFVVVFFNVSLWLTFRRLVKERFGFRSWRYELTIAIFLLFFSMAMGLRSIIDTKHLWEGDDVRTITLGMVQPDVPQAVKYEPMSREEQHDRLRLLSKKIIDGKDHLPVGLILWPETAIVDGPSFHLASKIWLQTLVRELNVPVLFGTLDAVESLPGSSDSQPVTYFNAATIVQPDMNFGPVYHKMHLVPFGEYVPLEKIIPWIRWLTPITGGFDAGKEAVIFNHAGFKSGPVICFEDTLPDITRKVALAGADLIVNLTNDAWFKSSCEPEMHAVNSIFRSVETRKPMVRCTNHGLTMIVSPIGEILFRGEPFKMNYFAETLKILSRGPTTFYTRYGDLFAYSCLTLTFLGILYCRVRSIR